MMVTVARYAEISAARRDLLSFKEALCFRNGLKQTDAANQEHQ
jgi:hypothetical protein